MYTPQIYMLLSQHEYLDAPVYFQFLSRQTISTIEFLLGGQLPYIYGL